MRDHPMALSTLVVTIMTMVPVGVVSTGPTKILAVFKSPQIISY
jgi:hypothetical protein